MQKISGIENESVPVKSLLSEAFLARVHARVLPLVLQYVLKKEGLFVEREEKERKRKRTPV